jgi:hypothetical protein
MVRAENGADVNSWSSLVALLCTGDRIGSYPPRRMSLEPFLPGSCGKSFVDPQTHH